MFNTHEHEVHYELSNEPKMNSIRGPPSAQKAVAVFRPKFEQ